MKYLFDNDISYRIAQMLRAVEVDATALRERYPENTDDSIFLEDLKNGEFDVFISNNTEQRRIPQERRLLKEAGVISLYFNPFWGKLKFWDQAVWCMARCKKIEGFCEGTAKGTCADLQANGTAKYFNL